MPFRKAMLGALAILAAAIISVAFTATPAHAIPGPFKIQNQALRLCLDSDPSGKDTILYMGRCAPGQRWGWYNGGFLKHLSSNMCVGVGSHPSLGHYGALEPCDVNWRDPYWTHQNFAITGNGSQCLQGGPHPGNYLPHVRCLTDTRHGWWVTYW